MWDLNLRLADELKKLFKDLSTSQKTLEAVERDQYYSGA